ncbi:MAG: ATP-binding protein [Patescibacteria group bacterium]
MNYFDSQILFLFFVIAVVILGTLYCWQIFYLKAKFQRRDEEMKRKVYELAILKELGERVGYSLNIPNIAEIICGSLNQFIKFSAVASMVVEGEKIIFKIHLEEPVSKEFVAAVRERMLNSLSALLDKKVVRRQVKEIISGAILTDEFNEPVRSFFNIPLVIGAQAAGVLTVADTKPGLYSEEDMTILYQIVGQASRAVSSLQEVVAAEQRKLNAMVESLTEGIVMTDKNYQIVAANPAVRQILNLEKPVGDLSIFDFIDNLEGKFDIRGKLEEAIKFDKIIKARETRINGKFWQIVAAPVKNKNREQEEILGGVVIFHDITEEKKLAQLREDFTSMIVHELRSPLTGIKKATELMQTQGSGENKIAYADYAKMINTSASEMLEMVGDLLDAAKIEAGKFSINKEPVDLRRIIKERVNFYAPQAQTAKLQLLLDISDNLPPVINADPKRLAQAIDNFISNALKFTPASGKVIVQALFHKKNSDLRAEGKALAQAWFLAEAKQNFKSFSDAVIIAVTDNGPGIKADVAKKLFSKFQQIPTSVNKTEIKGTGLGLSIVKGIAEAHGGIAGVETEAGAGSTFYFFIPL